MYALLGVRLDVRNLKIKYIWIFLYGHALTNNLDLDFKTYDMKFKI